MVTLEDKKPPQFDEQVKYQLDLYKIYSDDLKKFDTTCWQFPLALVSANFIAFNWFAGKWILLLALSILNFLFLLPLVKHVYLRQGIVKALKNIEQFLKKFFPTTQVVDFSMVEVHWWLRLDTLIIMAYGLVSLNTVFFFIALWKVAMSWCIC